MRQAFTLALTLAVLGAFFPAVVPKIGTVLESFLDFSLAVITAGAGFIGA